MTDLELVIAQEADGTFTVTEVSRLRISNHKTIKEARIAKAAIEQRDHDRPVRERTS